MISAVCVWFAIVVVIFVFNYEAHAKDRDDRDDSGQ